MQRYNDVFLLLSDSFSNNDPFEDNATNHLCSASCNKYSVNHFQDNVKLIDTETSSLIDKFINNLEHGSIVLGNLDLVGWAVIKKNCSWKSFRNVKNPLTKLKDLCDEKKTEDGQMKMMFKNYFQMVIKAIDFLKKLFRYHPSNFYLILT